MNKKNIIIALLFFCMLFEFGVINSQHQRIKQMEKEAADYQEGEIIALGKWKSDIINLVDFEEHPEAHLKVEKLEWDIADFKVIFEEMHGRKPKTY